MTPRPRTLVFHSVGASDPLEPVDVTRRLEDGLPNTLEEWIARDGLVAFKIKLNGGHLDADLERMVRIDRVVSRAQELRRVGDWKYLLDFNEGCPDVAYLIEFLRRVREATAAGFDRILYIEQPTARDLKRNDRQCNARGREASAGGRRRVPHRSRIAAARARDGLHRRGAQGLQGPEPGDADGSRGAEVPACSCACRTSPAPARR